MPGPRASEPSHLSSVFHREFITVMIQDFTSITTDGLCLLKHLRWQLFHQNNKPIYLRKPGNAHFVSRKNKCVLRLLAFVVGTCNSKERNEKTSQREKKMEWYYGEPTLPCDLHHSVFLGSLCSHLNVRVVVEFLLCARQCLGHWG